MLTQLYANNAVTTLATSVSPTDVTILVGSVANFPTPGPNQFFRATIDSGSGVEVIFVFGVTGLSFTDCLRGQEGTVAQNFQPGTQIECRVTRGTLEQFARYQDRLADLASLEALPAPGNADGNSYICATTDDAGTPIVAIDKGHSTWRFMNYATVSLSGAAQTGSTTTKLAFTGASAKVSAPLPGKYVIQFTTGALRGLARVVSVSDLTGVQWVTAMPSAPLVGDGFEIYQSTASVLSDLSSASDSGLIYAILFSE